MGCGQDERLRMDFIRSAVNEHKSSSLYETAVDARLYYEGENPTITKYEKIIYDMHGRAHVDMFTANHKIKSSFFTRDVDQQTGYLLGNGVTFNYSDTKEKLGTQDIPFDQQVSYAAEYSLIGGVAFGFWNLDHVDVFEITEFVPLYDEENGALMSGIRFWQVADDKPFRATLYELDGYTDYIQRRGKDMEQIAPGKRKYREFVSKSEVDGTKIYGGENYPYFPIVPIQNDKKCRSALCGKRNTLDAYDLVNSNMVNNVSEGDLIYWVLSGCGGMDDLDDAKFLDRLRTTHVVHTENDDNTTVTPHQVDAPVDGTISGSESLKTQLFEDFQMFNAAAVAAGNQTATAIWATYEPLDLKTNKFERQVTKFINGILKLAGIDDKPSYTRDKIINKMEETQVILMGAEYTTPEYITKKLLTICGDADMVEDILEAKAAEDLNKFNGGAGDGEDENTDTPTTDEAIDAAEEATGKTLNGSQTSSLITVIKGLKTGDITEGQAVRILTTSIGVTREEALAIIRGEE